MAYGAAFRHAHPLFSRLGEIAAAGAVFGSTHAEEVRLPNASAGICLHGAPAFREHRDGAMMSALRVARAFTGKRLIVRFAVTIMGISTRRCMTGSLAAASQTSDRAAPAFRTASALKPRSRAITFADLDRLLVDRDGELAAIAVEPVLVIWTGTSYPGFLEGLFERARRWTRCSFR